MKSKYSKVNVFLLNSSFNFEKSKDNSQISLNTTDEISIQNIFEDGFVLKVSRELTFEPLQNTYVKVLFEVIVSTSEKETVESIKKYIQENNNSLGIAFAKASLLISQITSASVFGPIITTPTYNTKKVLITTNLI